jgi:hypothetical protein
MKGTARKEDEKKTESTLETVNQLKDESFYKKDGRTCGRRGEF